MGLTKAAIARPVFVLMLMLGAILIGWLSYNSMHKELNPDVNFGSITVVTNYPGAGPEEVNNLISRKVESAVAGVNGIREITSTSREGVSVVSIAFELETNMDTALSDVRSKVDTIGSALPKEALKPSVSKNDFSSQPVLYLSVASTKLNARSLRDLIDKQLIDKFGQIQGVSSADVIGGDVREIQVQVKKDKLLAYGLGMTDIQRVINLAGGNIPAGKIITASQEIQVRVPADFTDPSQVRELIFTVTDPHGNGNGPAATKTVRLSDVATVTDSVQERSQYSRLNGLDNITIAISKTKEGNAVDITNAADKVVSDIQKQYKDQGITFIKTLESAKQITESLSDLQFSLAFGILLVAIIIFIFLHNFRGMLIVTLAIPTCIFASFVAMKLFGFTINSMSMLSLSLAIGVLVDDAIVVIENIYRHLRMGEDPREAAINGRSEIGLAAIAITLADVVVFLPIAFMGGIVGQFFKPLAMGFVMATVFSLFVSFTLTPMLASRWYRRGEDMEHPTGRFAIWFERMFGRVEHGYRNGLEWALNHRWFVFIMGFCVLVAVFMFIGGSFATQPAGAIQTGMSTFMVAVFLGLAVFGYNFAKNTFSFKFKRAGVWVLIGLGILTFLGMALSGTNAVLAAIAGLVLPLTVPFALLGLPALLANAFLKTTRYRFILFGVLFGLMFPLASLGGYFYAKWKQDAVFKFSFLPAADQGSLGINIQLPPGASLAETQRVVGRIEQIAMKDPDTKYVTSQVGSQSGGFGGGGATGSNYAQITLTLYDKQAPMDSLRELFSPSKERLRNVPTTFVSARLLQQIGHVPGASVLVDSGQGGGFGSPIQLGLGSNDHEALVATAKKIRDGLANNAVPGVINPDISAKEGKPELGLIPDRARMADANVSLADFGAFLRIAYSGNDDTKMRIKGDEYGIRVMLDLNDRNNPNIVQQLPVVFKQGNPITVGDLSTPRPTVAVDKIDRRNRLEEVRVTADVLPGNAPGTTQAKVEKWIKDSNLIPEGVALRSLGATDAQNREQGYMLGALLLGFLLVYMLLASLYDNLLYPLIIQLAQPMAFTGALLALALTDKQIDVVGFIGLVCLVGLVGKNAILVVDYANTLRHRGRTRHDALVEAGPTRLRPILMTTLALILGMSPIAFAIGRGSEFRQTIGIIIIGGISLSTLLTLIVIPCSYVIFDDISIAIGSLFRPGEEETPTPPVEEPPIRTSKPETGDPFSGGEVVRGGE